MFYLVPVLIILSVISIFWSGRLLRKGVNKRRDTLRRLEAECKELDKVNINLRNGNAGLEKFASEIIALYDITKDICTTLNEEKIFGIFRQRIDRYMQLGDCKFLKGQIDTRLYGEYSLLPLTLRKNSSPIGYLVASGIRNEDREKFHILAQQFLVGIKRSILYQKLQELTVTDSLTQVFTRRYFLERFDEEIERSRKFNLNCSFLMVDIDRFKDFNDRYGHLVGDAILREVTKAIKESIRQIDFMGRYGGEELAVVLAETDKEQARLVAERIRQGIEAKHIRVYDEDLRATISLGIATFPSNADNSGELLEKADQALYSAKNSGRNRVSSYEDNQKGR